MNKSVEISKSFCNQIETKTKLKKEKGLKMKSQEDTELTFSRGHTEYTQTYGTSSSSEELRTN